MTDLLHTTSSESRAPSRGSTTTQRPAPVLPTEPHAPWPRTAKVAVAFLALAAILAALGTFLATRSDDGANADLQEQVDVLTAEQARLTADLETATARAAALTSQRDELDQRLATVDADLATAVTERDQLTAQLATATIGISDLEAQLDAVTSDIARLRAERTGIVAERDGLRDSLAAAETEVADLEARLDGATDLTATLDERIAVLDVQVGYLLDRAVQAEAERDALVDLFPIAFDSSLEDVDLVGDWEITWDEAFCTGFATCGFVPGFEVLTITETPEGWLRAEVDGVFDTGLFRVDGALDGITQSVTAAPACDGRQRPAHVGLTLYAHGVTVLDDGTHQVDDLGASFVIDAPATGSCDAGVAVYGASLAN